MVRVRQDELSPTLRAGGPANRGWVSLATKRWWWLVWVAFVLTMWLLITPPAQVARAPLLCAPLLCVLALIGNRVYRARRAPQLLAFTWLLAGIFVPLSGVFRFAEPMFLSWRSAANHVDASLVGALVAVDITCGILIMHVTDRTLLEAAGGERS